MDERLINTLRAAALRVFRDGPVLVAYAFGSRVSGRPLPSSDLKDEFTRMHAIRLRRVAARGL